MLHQRVHVLGLPGAAAALAQISSSRLRRARRRCKKYTMPTMTTGRQGQHPGALHGFQLGRVRHGRDHPRRLHEDPPLLPQDSAFRRDACRRAASPRVALSNHASLLEPRNLSPRRQKLTFAISVDTRHKRNQVILSLNCSSSMALRLLWLASTRQNPLLSQERLDLHQLDPAASLAPPRPARPARGARPPDEGPVLVLRHLHRPRAAHRLAPAGAAAGAAAGTAVVPGPSSVPTAGIQAWTCCASSSRPSCPAHATTCRQACAVTRPLSLRARLWSAGGCRSCAPPPSCRRAARPARRPSSGVRRPVSRPPARSR